MLAEKNMGETANGISRPLSAGTMYWLRGRSIGALIFAFFGATDMFWALWFARDVPQMWSKAIWLVAVALGGWSITQRLLLRRLSVSAVDKSVARQRLKFLASWFLVVVVIEVISINLGKPILIHFHRLDLFPQWVEAVVGLHLLPLARLFNASVLRHGRGAGIGDLRFAADPRQQPSCHHDPCGIGSQSLGNRCHDSVSGCGVHSFGQDLTSRIFRARS